MNPNQKVCIGIVNDGSINSTLVIDLIKIGRQPNSNFDSLIQVANLGLTTRSRNVVVLNFLTQTEADWLLMIDSDEQLPLDAYNKLCKAAHHKERVVVSGLVFANMGDADEIQPIPTIYKMTPAGLEAIHDYPLDTIIPVDATGTGCLLVHRSVLELIQKNASEHQGKNWCWFTEGSIGGTYFGEDILFSKRLGQLGVKMYAHTGAILKHYKRFWLDERLHAPIRDAVIKSKEVQ